MRYWCTQCPWTGQIGEAYTSTDDTRYCPRCGAVLKQP